MLRTIPRTRAVCLLSAALVPLALVVAIVAGGAAVTLLLPVVALAALAVGGAHVVWTGRRVRVIAAAAEDARELLPEVVALDGAGDGPAVPAVATDGRGGLARLARAVEALAVASVDVAGHQARRHASVAAAAEGVARRDQALVERQLALVDRMERAHLEPEARELLLGFAQLATRIRRHTESLLVLAGVGAGRVARRPLQVADAVHAAAAEVDGGERVVVASEVDPPLTAPVALEVSHLVAELLDVALSGPADAAALVTVAPARDGVVVTVVGSGLDLSGDDLPAAAAALAGTANVQDGAELGLVVAGLLARRVGCGVRLEHADSGATVAVVELPSLLFVPGTVTVAPAADADERVDAEPVDSEPVDSEPVDSEPVDSEPVDVAPAVLVVDVEPVDAEPVDVAPAVLVVDVEPGDGEPVDVAPAVLVDDAVPVDVEPVDVEPVDADPVDVEPVPADDAAPMSASFADWVFDGFPVEEPSPEPLSAAHTVEAPVAEANQEALTEPLPGDLAAHLAAPDAPAVDVTDVEGTDPAPVDEVREPAVDEAPEVSVDEAVETAVDEAPEPVVDEAPEPAPAVRRAPTGQVDILPAKSSGRGRRLGRRRAGTAPAADTGARARSRFAEPSPGRTAAAPAAAAVSPAPVHEAGAPGGAPSGESSFAPSPVVASPFAESPFGGSPVAESPFGGSPVAEPPSVEPPFAASAIGNPDEDLATEFPFAASPFAASPFTSVPDATAAPREELAADQTWRRDDTSPGHSPSAESPFTEFPFAATDAPVAFADEPAPVAASSDWSADWSSDAAPEAPVDGDERWGVALHVPGLAEPVADSATVEVAPATDDPSRTGPAASWSAGPVPLAPPVPAPRSGSAPTPEPLTELLRQRSALASEALSELSRLSASPPVTPAAKTARAATTAEAPRGASGRCPALAPDVRSMLSATRADTVGDGRGAGGHGPGDGKGARR